MLFRPVLSQSADFKRTWPRPATIGWLTRIDVVTPPFSTSPDYLESIRGLHRLHELALAGHDEGPEADEVRDRLERPWHSLSDIERQRINGLSEDLHSIIAPPDAGSPTGPER